MEEFLSSHSNIGKDEINSLEKEIGNALDMKATNRPMSGSLFGNTSSKNNHNGNEANANGNNREENNQQQVSIYSRILSIYVFYTVYPINYKLYIVDTACKICTIFSS